MSTTDHIVCIRPKLEKKWEYYEAVCHLFIDFKKVYDSVRREVWYNILTAFGIPMKLLRPIKMGLNETYSRDRVGKHLSDMFPIRNGLTQGDALWPSLVNYANRRIQVNQDDLKLTGIHQLLVYDDNVNILGSSIHTIKKNTEYLVVASKMIGLEENADRTKYMVTSQDQNAGQSHNIKTDNSTFERVEHTRYLATRKNQNSIQEEINVS